MKLVINNPSCILTTNLNKITVVFNFSTMQSSIHTRSNVSLAVYTLFRCLCSVTQLCSTLCDPHGLQHTRLPCPSPTPGDCSNSCPSSRWCHPTISSSVIPFFSCLQSFPASGSFSNKSVLHIRWPKYWNFSSASVLPMNFQGWFPLGLTS